MEAVSESPRLDAELLLGLAINMPRAYLFAHPDDIADADAVSRLEQNVARRLAGEPLAYITGRKEFWSLELMVTPDTLVPRPETELLVELALREIPRDAAWRVLDLGTGSGAIAIAIARERPLCNVTATDRSIAALAVAKHNVRIHELSNVECVAGDWLAPVKDRQYDVVVTNPPYVETASADLKKLRAEPQQALVSGADGLDAIRILAVDCMKVLKNAGALLIEHGSAQQEAVRTILDEAGWHTVECHTDFAGLPRTTTARKIAPTITTPQETK